MVSHPNRSRTGGRIGRPPKAEGEHNVGLQITLPPDLAARVRADPDGPSKAIARALRATEPSA